MEEELGDHCGSDSVAVPINTNTNASASTRSRASIGNRNCTGVSLVLSAALALLLPFLICFYAKRPPGEIYVLVTPWSDTPGRWEDGTVWKNPPQPQTSVKWKIGRNGLAARDQSVCLIAVKKGLERQKTGMMDDRRWQYLLNKRRDLLVPGRSHFMERGEPLFVIFPPSTPRLFKVHSSVFLFLFPRTLFVNFPALAPLHKRLYLLLVPPWLMGSPRGSGHVAPLSTLAKSGANSNKTRSPPPKLSIPFAF